MWHPGRTMCSSWKYAEIFMDGERTRWRCNGAVVRRDDKFQYTILCVSVFLFWCLVYFIVSRVSHRPASGQISHVELLKFNTQHHTKDAISDIIFVFNSFIFISNEIATKMCGRRARTANDLHTLTCWLVHHISILRNTLIRDVSPFYDVIPHLCLILESLLCNFISNEIPVTLPLLTAWHLKNEIWVQ